MDKIQYYTQNDVLAMATRFHSTNSICQTEVENETNIYHE